MTARFHQAFGIVALAIVGIAFAWGIWIVGSPLTGRAQRFDERRLAHLRTIQNEIMNQVYEGGPRMPEIQPSKPLPTSLEEVVTNAKFERAEIVDPETGEPYEYTIQSAVRYRLCATFTFERREQYDVFWDHPAGRHCYDFDVTKPDGFAGSAGKPAAPIKR